jgi:maltose alpha-D-glucosyltransferase/alpha-amylase
MLDALRTKDNTWWKKGKFYSLYIDKFSKDIPGLIHKLPYFQTLGIDCLHILPHYPSPMRDGGYDVTDHTGVRAELGTIDDFKNLCDEAHKLNIKIMVDLVLNHTSIDHQWFQEAKQSTTNPKRDFYIWSDTANEFQGAPNAFPDFKDSNWIWNEQTEDYFFATFKPSQPELNWDNPQVFESMMEILDTLVSYGIDGIRLDAISHLVEQENTNFLGTPKTHVATKHIRSHIDSKYPHIIMLGEVIGTTEFSKKFFGNNDECHLSYNFELMSEMLYALKMGDKKDRLKTVIAASREIPTGASWMSFLRNHDSIIVNTLDEERKNKLIEALDPNDKFKFTHNTETVQRLWNVCGEDREMVKEAFSMLYSLPTANVMYYGDEIGLANSSLPEGEADMRYTVRGTFDWAEADKQMKDPDSLFHHVRKLIQK